MLDLDGPLADAGVGRRDAGAAAAPPPPAVARRARLGVAVVGTIHGCRDPRLVAVAAVGRGRVAAAGGGLLGRGPALLAPAAAVLEVDALAEAALRLVDVGAPVDQREHLLLGHRLRGEQRRDRLVAIGVVDAHVWRSPRYGPEPATTMR